MFARVLPRSPRFATEVERLHAGLEPLRRQELEMPRTRQAMKQRRPAATDDGMNDDAVLVDEPQLLERSRELGRSDEDTSLGLRFQRRDRLAKVTLHLDRVLPRKVAPRARHDVLRLRLELLRPLAHRARRLFVACHRGPGSLHQLVGVAPEEHRPALIHELGPEVEQLVVHDPLGVIDAPVQSHVETEGEEAHSVGFYQKRRQLAVWISVLDLLTRYQSQQGSWATTVGRYWAGCVRRCVRVPSPAQ